MPRAISRWDPFAELSEFRGPWERLLGWRPLDDQHEWMPAIDIERSNGDLVLRADVPGIKPEEVRIEIEDNILTVRGEHMDSSEKQKKDYLRRERRYGAFSRSMALPEGVDPKKVKAQTHDGIVEVTIPLPKETKAERVSITPKAG